jgi:hypothetical protein
MSYYDEPHYTPERRALYQTLSVIETSMQHARNLEAAEIARIEKQKADAENERLSAWHLEDTRRKQAVEEEAKRKEAASNFEADLKRQFFDGNPFASEFDFQTMLPELRKRAMLENTGTADKSEEMMRASGNYSRM